MESSSSKGLVDSAKGLVGDRGVMALDIIGYKYHNIHNHPKSRGQNRWESCKTRLFSSVRTELNKNQSMAIIIMCDV